MKFAEWNLLYHMARARKVMEADTMRAEQWYAQRGRSLHEFVKKRAWIEWHWIKESSPFYNVYPVIAEPLLRVNLELETQWLRFPVQPILIRFSEPLDTGGYRLSNQIVFVDQGRMHIVAQTPDVIDAGLPGCVVVETDIGQSGNLEQMFTNTQRTAAVKPEDEKLFTAAMRVAAGVALLARDSDIVEPELLASDRGKPLEQRLIDRANRRGLRGWSLGKSLATGPHLRKPHFAIRWMGKGRVDPRLRPVKGSLVNKHIVAKVPTGFLADNDAVGESE